MTRPTHIIRDSRHPALGGEEKLVLIMLADRLPNITPSIQTIADDCGISRKTASRVIAWLMSVGIVVESKDAGHRAFTLDLDQLQTLPCDAARDTKRVGPTVPSMSPTVPPVGPADHVTQAAEPLPMGPPVQVVGPTVPEHGTHGPTKVQDKVQRRNKGESAGRAPAAQVGQVGDLFLKFERPVDFSTVESAIRSVDVGSGEALGASVDVLPVQAPKPAKKAPKRAKDGTEWPEDFCLDADLVAFAVSKGMSGPVQAAEQFEKFKNRNLSKGQKYKDWRAAWRTWCCNFRDYGPKQSGGNYSRNGTGSSMQTGTYGVDYFDAPDTNFGDLSS